MVTLTRLGGLDIYAEDVTGSASRCIFFIPRRPAGGLSFTLSQALADGGILLLAPATQNFSVMLDIGKRLLAVVREHAAIAWYRAGDGPIENARRLEIDKNGKIQKFIQAIYIERELGDVLGVNSRMRWVPTDAAKNAQLFAGPNSITLLCKPNESPFNCWFDATPFILLRTPAANGMEELASIQFTGDLESGSWLFSIAPQAALDALKKFSPGMSYVMEDDSGFGSLIPENFPVFDLDGAAPLGNVSALAINVNAYATGSTGNYIELQSKVTKLSLASNFVTRRGSQVKLKAAVARMHFTPNTGASSFAMSPVGVFELDAPPTAYDATRGIKIVDLLTGSAGTEYVTFAASPGNPELPDAIEFVEGRNAFAMKTNGGFELGSRSLTSYVRPAWTSTRASGEFSYVAQSEEAPLFEAPVSLPAARLFESPTGLSFAPKPRAVNAAQGAMPWLPMRNAIRPSATPFDRLVAGVARRGIAAETQRSYQALGRQAGDWTVTPQGFFVQVDDAGYWQTIRFAAGQGDAISVEFDRPPNAARWRMEEALSRPASFLVASRSPQPGPSEPPELGEFRISAHDWKLTCNFAAPQVKAAPQCAPLLIVKFGPGKVTDLLQKTESWALASEFNAKPEQARLDVERAVGILKGLSNGVSPMADGGEANLPQDVKDAYGRLYAKLDDPNWNGVLLFNAGSALDKLPDAVAALAAGESSDLKKLWVPVMGVDLSRVGENLTQKSSLFGAVHRFDSKIVGNPSPQAYGLKLRNLDTHIENSLLTSFVAKAQMWVGNLMGDALQSADGEGNPIIEVEGRYEGKSAEGEPPRYVIKALGNQYLAFTSKKLLETIEVNRLELVSTRPSPDVVTGTISLWGNVVLGSEVVSFSGVKSVKFGELAITLELKKEKNPDFALSAGSVSVAWDPRDDSGVTGWLKSFPLRLSGFRWSGMGGTGASGGAGLHWPDIGFTNLGLGSFGNLPAMTASNFDFGLEFDLNLGGFGGMTDAAKMLSAKFLLGWRDFSRNIPDLGKRLGLGFRFEGGSAPLDVGVQGVFKLKAKKVILKTYTSKDPSITLIGFGLDEPRLEIMGYEMPKTAAIQLAIVVEAKKPAVQPTWIFASREFDALPLHLDYFAIGQNVLLLEETAQPSSASDAVQKSDKWVGDSFEKKELGRLRPKVPQGNKWGLAASGTLKEFVKFDVAFMDEISLYGLHVEIPDKNPFFCADVLYRKISDDLGIFSVEIDPNLPSIEIAIGSLTLPILSFDRLTNGGGGINIGFNANDFSKAATIQAIPFLGSLGVKVGQYTGLSSAFLLAGASGALVDRYAKLDLSPVHEVHLSFRFGFGKEIRQSIFRAGVSLTVYGLFQGALAKVQNPPTANPITQYIKVAGAAGILLEIFGAIDFALISAAVSIRVWVEVGFIVETWQPIEIYGEAGVSVYVKFVIARFEVFGRSFEIAVHFSFATTVRFGHQFDRRLGGMPPELPAKTLSGSGLRSRTAAEPIDWTALDLGRTWSLPLVPSMDLVLGDAGQPSVVPLLVVHNPAPHGRAPQAGGDSVMDLVTGLFRWAVRLHAKTPQSDPTVVTREGLAALQARLRSVAGAPASRWIAMSRAGNATQPLDANAIKAFFELNFRFTLVSPSVAKTQIAKLFPERHNPADDLEAIVFPWLREIEIHAVSQTAGGGSRPLRRFHLATFETVTPVWEDGLKRALKKGRPEYPPIDNEHLITDQPLMPGGGAPQTKSALDLMLEDWVGAVLEALVGDVLMRMPPDLKKEVSFQGLLQDLTSGRVPLALQAAQRASSVLLHGLRVPSANFGNWVSLAAFSSLDIDLSIAANKRALHDAEDIDLCLGGAANSWLYGAASLQIKNPRAAADAAVLAKSIPGKSLTLNIAFDEHQSNDDDGGILAVVFGPGSEPKILNAKAPIASRLFSVPQRLKDAVASGSGPVGIAFKRFVPFCSPKSTEPIAGVPASTTVYLAGLFNLRIRKVRAATASSPGLIAISGAGEEARQILDSWKKDGSIAPDSFRFVVPGARSGPPSFIVDGVKFFTTNLSTESNPDSSRLMSLNGTSPVLVELSDTANMREFLWMASVVNDAGFFASIGGAAWTVLEEQLFKESEFADAAVAWLRKAFDSNTGKGVIVRAETLALVEDAGSFPSDLGIRALVNGRKETQDTAPAGFVSLVVTMDYTENDPAKVDDEVELLSRYVFLEHCVTVQNKTMLTFDESPALPAEPPENLNVSRPFASQTATKLVYRVSVPLGKFLSPAMAAAAVSGPASSPYMFIGQDLSKLLTFGLRDACGHRFPGSIVPTWASKVVLFRNSLPHLGTMAGLKLTWVPLPAGEFRLELKFERPADFDAGEGLLGPYRDLKFNLDTKYIAANIEVLLSDGVAPQAADIVSTNAGVLAVIEKLVKDILAPSKPKSVLAEFKFKVPAAKIDAKVKTIPQELSLRLRLARTKYVDPIALESNPAVGEVVAVVRPAVGDSKKEWQDFADKVEEAYPTIFAARMSLGSGGSTVWIGNGALLQAPFDARYELQSFAPIPLSKQFSSGEAWMLDQYGADVPGAPRKEADDVDLDLLMEQTFDLFEEVVEPGVAGKLAAFAPNTFIKLMESKRSIVNSFKKRLRPIECRKAANQGNPEQVGKRFHSLGAKDLRAIYRLGAIAMVTNTASAVAQSTPRIYGQVTAPSGDSSVDWSRIRLPLQANALAVVSASWKPESRVASAPFPTSVTPSHIEWPWPGSEKDDYAPSRWLELLSRKGLKPRVLDVAAGTEVPLPLRKLPPAPKVFGHEGRAANLTLGSISDVRGWTYRVDMAVPSEPQDTMKVGLDYLPQTAFRARSRQRSLFDSLVGIAHHRETLDGYLSVLKKDGTPADKVAELGGYFERFFTDLATTLDAHDIPVPMLPRVGEHADELSATIRVEAATMILDREFSTSGNREARLELAFIDGGRSPLTIVPNPVFTKKSTTYKNTADVKKATRGVAGLSGRRVTVTGLDILNQPLVMPAISALRNKKLGKVDIDEAFILATPESKSATEFVAHLTQPEGFHRISTAVGSLATHLKTLAVKLFGNDGANVTVDADARLLVPLDKAGKKVFSSPLGALKGCKPDANGAFASLFETWGVELATALGSGAVDPETPPQGVQLSLTVYANYAGDLPILVLPRLWITWGEITPSATHSSIPGRSFDFSGLLDSLYWLTGGLRPDTPNEQAEVSRLRLKIAHLLQRSPCYNYLPASSTLPARERDAQAMAEAWHACEDIVRPLAAANKPNQASGEVLGWFLAPVDEVTGLSEPDILRALVNGPFLPTVDWKVRTSKPAESAWRAVDDPFAARHVVLVEILKK